MQLKEMMDKVYIMPIVSSYEAPTLFVKKKYGTIDYVLTIGN